MSAPSRLRRRRELVGASFAFGVGVVLAASRLLVDPRFYFADDTQLGTIGIWREMSRMLVSGDVSILNPHAWQAGNYLAEGQWGFLNPLSWLLALGSTAVDDVVVYVTIVKLILFGALGVGVYLLTCSFGATPAWALAAAVIVPTAGFTVYIDGASWISGLFDSVYFAFTWWGLRRLVSGRSPVPFFLAAYLLVTYGYVFGVLMLAGLLVLELGRAGLQRRRIRLLRVVGASTFAGLLTIVVYLPGVLTASITERGSASIAQSFFLTADLSDVTALVAPTAAASVGSWSGAVTAAPMLSVSWALLLLPLVWPAVRRSWKPLLVPLLFALAVLLLVVGPSQIGPIRWPVRFMPFLALALALVLAVVASRGLPRLATWRRFALAAAIGVFALWVAWVQTPPERSVLVVGVVVIGLLALVTFLSRRGPVARRSGRAALVVVISTALLVGPQMLAFPRTPLPTFAVPSSATEMEGILGDGVDDGISVGNVYADAATPGFFDEVLPANLWYFSSTRVSSTYTVLPVRAYVADLCVDLRGSTCPEALTSLLATDETTGSTLAELLGVNTIVAIRSSYPDGVPDPGTEWETRSAGDRAEILVRRDPVTTAGALAWTGDGTDVTVLAESSTEVRFRVDAVGSDGRVVFKRIAWPGYGVDGARLTDPLRGYLLTADVAEARPGDVVVVSFRPPGFWIEAIALVAALAIIPLWLIRRARSRKVLTP